MKLIKNSPEYYDFILDLRNTDSVRTYFGNEEIIPKEDHYRFMEKYGEHYYICLNEDNIPVGFIGQVNGDIRLAVDPNYQGRGIGTYMINEIMVMYPNAFAKVKIENHSSLKAFENAGFIKTYYILEQS